MAVPFSIILLATMPGAIGAPHAGVIRHPPADTPAAAAPVAPAAVEQGGIEGRLVMRSEPVRRRAERYPGGVAPARAVQAIPAVVFLRGAMRREPAARTRASLIQQDTTFVPAVVIVGTGSTIDFPNGDPFFHNVFSYSPAKRFDLGRFPQGESRSVRFDEPGIVRVYCEVHETMRSAVIVTANPFHAIVNRDGSFSIPDVPAGRWELEVWHADHRGQVVPVTVEAGRITRLKLTLE